MINNTTDSTIKGVIDTWYQTNMTSYTEKIEDTIWCNDRSSRVDGSDTYFGSYDRTTRSHSPSLGCVNDTDKFTVNETYGNGLLTYPVALLIADEIMLAGGKWNTNNSSYYLYTNKDWWALSPGYFYNNGVSGLDIDQYGNLSGGVINAWDEVRPSVSLVPNAKFTSGNGSMEKPYEV